MIVVCCSACAAEIPDPSIAWPGWTHDERGLLPCGLYCTEDCVPAGVFLGCSASERLGSLPVSMQAAFLEQASLELSISPDRPQRPPRRAYVLESLLRQLERGTISSALFWSEIRRLDLSCRLVHAESEMAVHLDELDWQNRTARCLPPSR